MPRPAHRRPRGIATARRFPARRRPGPRRAAPPSHPSPSHPLPSHSGGFVLLIVLWTLGLLAAFTVGLIAAGREQVRLAGNIRDSAIAQAAADGAAQEAIFHLAAGQWAPGPQTHTLRLGGSSVIVRIDNEAGLVNPNNAPTALLAALLHVLGASPDAAQQLADEMTEYHNAGGADPAPYIAAGLPYGPPRRNFRSVGELRMLPGMTPALFERLLPHVSVWTGLLVPSAADPVVTAALNEAGPAGSPDPLDAPRLAEMHVYDDQFVRVAATAWTGGARFTRLAEVELSGQPDDQRPPPYQILAWARPEE